MQDFIFIDEKDNSGEHSIAKFSHSLFLHTWNKTKSVQQALKSLATYNNDTLHYFIDRIPFKINEEKISRSLMGSACAVMEQNYNLEVISSPELDDYFNKTLKTVTPKEPLPVDALDKIKSSDKKVEFLIQNKQVLYVLHYISIFDKLNNVLDRPQEIINSEVIEHMFLKFKEIDQVDSIEIDLANKKFYARTYNGFIIDDILKDLKEFINK